MDTNKPRTSDEVARRSLVLYSAIAATHGVSKNDLAQWLKGENLWEELTPRELRFLTQAEPPERERIWMTWFAEAEYTLLWSIGKIESLPLPTSKCDTDLIIGAIPLWQSTASFIHSAVLKEVEVRQETERIYNIRAAKNILLRIIDKLVGIKLLGHSALAFLPSYPLVYFGQ